MDAEPLIPKHGGYRKLKSFQIAQLTYDLTARFCGLYIEKRSRTRDQMEQAARSGVQNIAEGSQFSATSKKMELKLTNVARASLEELRLDYEDFLRQRGMTPLPPEHPALARFKARRCATLEEVRAWVEEEHKRARAGAAKHGRTRTDTDSHGMTTGKQGQEVGEHEQTQTTTDRHGQTQTETGGHGQGKTPKPSVLVGESPCESVSLSRSALVANAALSLLNLCCHLLDRQIASLAKSFENKGGFTERLYRVRSEKRRQKP